VVAGRVIVENSGGKKEMQSYNKCKWCRGRGCLYCHEERRRDQEEPELLFTADPNDPEDMRQLGEVFGRQAFERAFTEGDGIAEIKRNAALATLMQIIRKSRSDGVDTSGPKSEGDLGK